MQDHAHNDVQFRFLNVVDEFSRECLAVKVARILTSRHVIEVPTDLFIEQGVPRCTFAWTMARNSLPSVSETG